MEGPPPDSPPLCATCGICCGDALFGHSEIKPEEAPRMRALGFPLDSSGGKEIFLHPCAHLSGTECRVYEHQPQSCRAFRCPTLNALERGEIERDEADRRVTAAKAEIASVQRHLAAGERVWTFRQRIAADPLAPPDVRLALMKFDIVMDRYFRAGSDRVLVQNPTP